jgi:hypothetical protein
MPYDGIDVALAATWLEQADELAYPIQHELDGERRQQNTKDACNDVQATGTKQAASIAQRQSRSRSV